MSTPSLSKNTDIIQSITQGAIKVFNTLPKCINLKANVIARLELELVYFSTTIQQFSHYTLLSFLFRPILSIIIIFINPSVRAGYDTRSIFKPSLTGLNSKYSFSETSCLTKAEEPILSYYLPKAGGRIIGFIPFPRVLVLLVPDIGLAVRVFAKARETWVQSQVESYQRLKKWYLMPPCLTLSIIRCGSRVK